MKFYTYNNFYKDKSYIIKKEARQKKIFEIATHGKLTKCSISQYNKACAFYDLVKLYNDRCYYFLETETEFNVNDPKRKRAEKRNDDRLPEIKKQARYFKLKPDFHLSAGAVAFLTPDNHMLYIAY